MSVNYAAEAAKLLQSAARHITEHPQDMRIAEVSALVGNGFASLAHLPEQQVIAHERAKSAEDRLEMVLGVVVEHLVQMSTNWRPELREQAAALMRDLDEIGVEIDQRVDELSEKQGRGPSLYDAFGLRYDLAKQWLDSHGKRWEHRGGWDDLGTPVMHRDAPDGESMLLIELIRERGPLHVVRSAPPSPVVREVHAPF